MREGKRGGEKCFQAFFQRLTESFQTFFKRSIEFCRLEFIETRTKVHCLDEGYAHIPQMRDFIEDQKEEILGNQRFRAREAS